jgi:glycosyltransferase involved in cell wall biosynthesis
MASENLQIVHLNSADIWRGAEQQLSYIMDNFPEPFYPTLFCLKDSPLYTKALEKTWRVHSFKKYVGLNPGLAFALKTYISQNKVDLFHIHDPHSLNGWWLATMMGMKIPAIVHRRVDFITGQNPLSRLKYNHPLIKKIICVSEQVREVMKPVVDNYDKLICLYDCVDTTLYRKSTISSILEERFPESKGKIKIATIAALVDHKDIPTFIRMAEGIIKSGNTSYHFFIIGEGTLKNDLSDMIKQKGMESNVHMTGFINDIPAVLNDLDVFVFTSKSEAFGSTILEVLSSETPVIATNIGAAKEILTHGKDALMTEAGNVEDLANHVLEVLNNTSLRNQLVKNGLLTADKFSVDSYKKALSEVYLSCLNK